MCDGTSAVGESRHRIRWSLYQRDDDVAPRHPQLFEAAGGCRFNSKFDAGRPGGRSKPSLAQRMPAYVRRATVDCALSAGWVCIATLATVDPVRWRAICYALSDAFALKLTTLEAMTLQSLHRARTSVGGSGPPCQNAPASSILQSFIAW